MARQKKTVKPVVLGIYMSDKNKKYLLKEKKLYEKEIGKKVSLSAYCVGVLMGEIYK